MYEQAIKELISYLLYLSSAESGVDNVLEIKFVRWYTSTLEHRHKDRDGRKREIAVFQFSLMILLQW
jgi:hypothetical protein